MADAKSVGKVEVTKPNGKPHFVPIGLSKNPVFMQRKGYKKVVSASQPHTPAVIPDEPPIQPPAQEAPTPPADIPVKAVKLANANTVKKAIREAKTADALHKLVEHETRAGVLTAYQKALEKIK